VTNGPPRRPDNGSTAWKTDDLSHKGNAGYRKKD